MARILVWDWPTRLFHWALVACVIGAFITAKIGGKLMIWHGRIGLVILGLLVFRVIWGFVGSTYARFTRFVRGPEVIQAYLRGKWQGQGHNPLGAMSVLALLGVLILQAASGLFANDDIAYEGYLYALVGNELSTRLTGIHHLLEKLLLMLVAAHLGAIAFHTYVRKHNLVRPMMDGHAEGRPDEAARGGGNAALIAAALIAGTAAWAAAGTFLPPPSAPPAGQQAPDF